MMMATVRCGVPTLFLPHYRRWPILSEIGENGDKKDEGLSLAYSQCAMLALLEIFGLARTGTIEEIFSNQKKEKPAASAHGGQEGDPVESEMAEWGSKRIVEMARQKVSPRRFFSASAFHNAAAVDMALGSSSETVLHLSALAIEAGVPLAPAFFNDIAKKIPQLVPMNRSGEYPM